MDGIYFILLKSYFIIIINIYLFLRSNLIQEHWTNYILTTPKPIFYSAHPMKEVQQNSYAIANDIQEVIDKVSSSKITAVVTNNASVMKKAWRILEVEYPKIIFLECIAHNLNLIIGDIMKLKWSADILKDAKAIVKYFRNHQVLAAILK